MMLKKSGIHQGLLGERGNPDIRLLVKVLDQSTPSICYDCIYTLFVAGKPNDHPQGVAYIHLKQPVRQNARKSQKKIDLHLIIPVSQKY